MNPENASNKQKIMKAAAQKAFPKKKPAKHVIQVKVLDFTIWKGFKFGLGFAIGTFAFSVVMGILLFVLHLTLIGAFTAIGGSGV